MNKTVAIILGVVLAIALGAGATYLLMKPAQDKQALIAGQAQLSARGESSSASSTTPTSSATVTSSATATKKTSSSPTEPSTESQPESSNPARSQEPSAQGKPSDNDKAASDNTRGLQCDGRGVLIVNSILDYGSNVDSEYRATVAQHPGAQLVPPGTCASLRPEVNGVKIHAVVLDYGHDIPALCSAAASLGGNPRILSNEADYSSPC